MNAKIERTNVEIGKTKDKIADFQAKLRELEQRKITYENEEIVALFRKEKFTEADLQVYISAKREAGQNGGGSSHPPLAADLIRAGETGTRQDTDLPGGKEDDYGNEN